jgi:hypothetical protein
VSDYMWVWIIHEMILKEKSMSKSKSNRIPMNDNNDKNKINYSDY